jgi:arsenate reductase (thioredoxin)
MAEGLLRHRGRGRFESFSAGTEATAVRAEAITVMAELGIDISAQASETIERYLGETFDWVITVCDRAREACPFFPGARNTEHWGFDDPADVAGGEDERLVAFRRVRDEIDARVLAFVATDGARDGVAAGDPP